VANDLGSAPLITFLEDARSFYFGLQDRLPIAGEHVRVLLEQLKFKLEAQQHTSPSQAVPSPATPQQLTTAPPPNQGDEVVTEIDDLEARVSDDQEERRLKRSFDKPVIDREGFRVFWKNKIYTFKNTKEFLILAYLASNFGSWVPVNSLHNHVWKDSVVETNTVQKTVSNLRRRLKELGIADSLTIDGSNRDHYMLRRP
jgi:DNA-binding response OmpR family regulator